MQGPCAPFIVDCCLPGVTAKFGRFGRGDPVATSARDGAILGAGLARYNRAGNRVGECRGHRSEEIRGALAIRDAQR